MLIAILTISSCGIMQPKWKKIIFTKEETEAVNLLNLQPDKLKQLKSRPLFKLTPNELDIYLGYLQTIEPDLRKRIQHLAQKCVGQPYQLYLLGEFPFEIYDPEPLYSLKKSDCVVFSEHIYAMALSYDWKSFFTMLQRIRYKNGEIGLATRNHYTEFDWNVNNNWLVQDITEELAGDQTAWETTVINRAKFLSKWGIEQFIPIDTVKWSYIPYELLPKVIDKLQPGDFVNIVRGYEHNKWVGHVGLITVSEDSTVNFLNSTRPMVKEELLMDRCKDEKQTSEGNKRYNEEIKLKNQKILADNERLRQKNKGIKSSKEKKVIATKPYFYGFKFLRLREDPLWELIKLEGPLAPKLKISPIFD
jgi:hypothetical protein